MNEDLFTLISTVVGGTFLANVVANRKNVLDDKQKIIDQLQEERAHFSEELKELHILIRNVEERNLEILKEKNAVEWERDKLLEENSLLKTTILNLEQRVSHLEKEEKEWKSY